MARQQRTSQLCPNCGILVSSQAPQCPRCGIAHPGTWWKRAVLASGLRTANQCITALLVLNIGMYILSLLLNPAGSDFTMHPFRALSPAQPSLFLLGATGTIPIDRYHRWWTLIAANYLHGSILHILFNMIALRQIIPLIVQVYGVSRMITLYTLTGVIGFIISYLAGIPLTIGASAALCGLIGAALYYGKDRGGTFGQIIFRQIGGWALSIFLFGFLIPGINNWAHGGGMVAGALLGALFGYEEKRPQQLADRLLANALILVTLLVLAWGILSGLTYSLTA